MVKTEHLGPALPGCAVCVDQHLWVNLEMGLRHGMDVVCGQCVIDPIALTQQYPTAFAWMCGAGLGLQLGNCLSCHHDIHRPWP